MKIGIGLSLAQILPDKMNKMFLPKNLGFIILTRSVYPIVYFMSSKRHLPLDDTRQEENFLDAVSL